MRGKPRILWQRKTCSFSHLCSLILPTWYTTRTQRVCVFHISLVSAFAFFSLEKGGNCFRIFIVLARSLNYPTLSFNHIHIIYNIYIIYIYVCVCVYIYMLINYQLKISSTYRVIITANFLSSFKLILLVDYSLCNSCPFFFGAASFLGRRFFLFHIFSLTFTRNSALSSSTIFRSP